LLLAALIASLSLRPGAARADDAASAAEALAAAQRWVQEIDAGQYVQSYEEGCTAFHNKVSQEQWVTILKALRPALGTLISRKEASHSYRPDGFEGLDGECMVVTYNTSFSKMASDVEVVVLKREDGQWRGAGYNAQPQGPDPAPGAAESEQTQSDQKLQTNPGSQ
jgi:hypothetical protein